MASDRKHNPDDGEYVFMGSSSGHVGFKNLKRAAIMGALSPIFTVGNNTGSSIAGITTLVFSGGYRNVYYTEESYHPYGTDIKGRPIWKNIIKLYSGNDRSHLIDVIKVDADLIVTY